MKPTFICLSFTSLDGALPHATCSYDCLDAARQRAAHWVGEQPEIGPQYAVGDGGKLTADGCTLDMLFPHADEPTTFRRMT